MCICFLFTPLGSLVSHETTLQSYYHRTECRASVKPIVAKQHKDEHKNPC